MKKNVQPYRFEPTSESALMKSQKEFLKKQREIAELSNPFLKNHTKSVCSCENCGASYSMSNLCCRHFSNFEILTPAGKKVQQKISKAIGFTENCITSSPVFSSYMSEKQQEINNSDDDGETKELDGEDMEGSK
ncbi:unnamed protein product [Caenorhabditis brenneri]